MTKGFCTVISSDFLPFARALFQSINKFGEDIEFTVLIVNDHQQIGDEKFKVLFPHQLSEKELANKILLKYHNELDGLRWSLKSLLMVHLLEKEGFDQVFFVDPDLYFFSDFSFLTKELEDRSFLLSPHWKQMDPMTDEKEFLANFTDGIFNAGFLGATIKGVETLRWWANMCLYSAKRIVDEPLYADQSYLELFPIRNPDARILTHRGCNVAIWNKEECKRVVSDSGEVLINGIYPIVFVHFSHTYDLYKQDKSLLPYLVEYSNALIENGHPTGIIKPARNYFYRQALKRLTFLQRFKRKYLGVKYFDESEF